MKLLLHVCCAPCSVASIVSLREEGIEPVLFWYNPNIHLFTEYTMRRDALLRYAGDLGLHLIAEDEYGLKQFIAVLQQTAGRDDVTACFDSPHRCMHCYRLRMEKTACTAKENGFDAFSTTLFISPYQNHELLKEEAQAAADKHGVTLLYRDFRPLFREGRAEARVLGLYMQKYCGCIFSEADRYNT
ncbi:MAG: epoxyqueuosine reductase QueH [Treponema sp.]|nr:epoxyqueuosine reductase QueH [Treponema sp.]